MNGTRKMANVNMLRFWLSSKKLKLKGRYEYFRNETVQPIVHFFQTYFDRYLSLWDLRTLNASFWLAGTLDCKDSQSTADFDTRLAAIVKGRCKPEDDWDAWIVSTQNMFFSIQFVIVGMFFFFNFNARYIVDNLFITCPLKGILWKNTFEISKLLRH